MNEKEKDRLPDGDPDITDVWEDDSYSDDTESGESDEGTGQEAVWKSIWPAWTLVRELGHGGFGVVYEAVRRENGIESRAAIKVIHVGAPPEGTAEAAAYRKLAEAERQTYIQDTTQSLTDEIRTMSDMKGSVNTVTAEDYDTITDENGEKTIFIRMELLTPFLSWDGSTDEDAESAAIRLGCDICRALERCEDMKVIHRDVKPENIMVAADGTFKLGDFGIARHFDGGESLYTNRGTEDYKAPEVINDPTYDNRVDIYSLGLVLYRQLNHRMLPFMPSGGALLFSDEQRLEARTKRLRGDEMPPPADATPEMAEVILRACAPNPEDRFATAAEFRKALEEVKAGTYTVIGFAPGLKEAAAARAKERKRLARKSKWGKKRVITMSCIGALLLVLLAGVLFGIKQCRDKQTADKKARLDEISVCIDNGWWKQALENIQNLQNQYPLDYSLKNLDEQWKGYLDRLCDEAEQETADLVARGDYAGVVVNYERLADKLENDKDLQALAEHLGEEYVKELQFTIKKMNSAAAAYRQAYVEEIELKLEPLTAAGDIEGAEALLEEAINAVGGDETLEALYTELTGKTWGRIEEDTSADTSEDTTADTSAEPATGEPTTEPVTEPGTEPKTEPASEPVTEPGTEPESMHTHAFGAWTVVREPTCTEKGLEQRVCDCGETEQNPLPPAGHKSEDIPAIPATCTADGLSAGKKCRVCGVELGARNVIPAVGHTVVTDAAVAPTCTTEGLTAGSHCAVCGVTIIKQTGIPTIDHTPEILPAVAPTCTETGLTEGIKCAVCGEILAEQTIIPQADHTPEILPAVAPTCTETGLTEGIKCAVCGQTLVGQTIVPTAEHTELIHAGTPSTCIEKGTSDWSECAVCGQIIHAQETLPALLHNFVGNICTRCGAPKPSEGLEMTKQWDGTYSVDGIGSFTGTDLIIPSIMPDGGKVTKIEESAFMNCSLLKTVEIPDTVTAIGYQAFYGCTDLTSITIPESVTTISGYAFFGCIHLKNIVVPAGVTQIYLGTFYNCTELTNVSLPATITAIYDWAFCGCTNLTNVEIPNGVTTISRGVFRDCAGLTNVTIPDSVITIDRDAFDGCTNLTNVTLPDGVTSIGDFAFMYCTHLTSITLPDSITSIGTQAFYDCSELVNITIPVSVTSIDDLAFYYCANLTIYCEAPSQPSGWASYWNPDNRPVVWGYTP